MFTVQIVDCERKARTLAAIKFVREVRQLSLAEAKGLIDDVYYHNRPVSLDFHNEQDAVNFARHMEALGFLVRISTFGN